jgi:uncharacterized protein with HEPN domain
MNDEVRKHLQDILDCIVFIETQIGQPRLFANYKENSLLKAAVERKLEIIGEALQRCIKRQPDILITNREKIVGTRNRIIHAYDAVDDILIWEIVINHLPILKAEVVSHLQDDRSDAK